MSAFRFEALSNKVATLTTAAQLCGNKRAEKYWRAHHSHLRYLIERKLGLVS